MNQPNIGIYMLTNTPMTIRTNINIRTPSTCMNTHTGTTTSTDTCIPMKGTGITTFTVTTMAPMIMTMPAMIPNPTTIHIDLQQTLVLCCFVLLGGFTFGRLSAPPAQPIVER